MTPTYTLLMQAQSKRHSGVQMEAKIYSSAEELVDSIMERKARMGLLPKRVMVKRALELTADTIAALPAPTLPPRRERLPKDILDVATAPPVDVPLTDAQQIIRETCLKHGFTRGELFSARRARLLVAARHEAMFRLSKETNMSLPAIGRRLGGRDHSTVLHGIRKHAAKLKAAEANG